VNALKPSIVITIYGKPITKENSFGKGKSGHLFKQKKYVEWENNARFVATESMKNAGWPGPWAGRVGIMANFRFNTFNARDIQNYWKSILDALNGAVYDDDSQIDFTAQVRQKDSIDPSIILYVYFYDFMIDDLGKNKPQVWEEFDVCKLGIPAFYPVIYDPADAEPCKFSVYGEGSQAERREIRTLQRKREKASLKIDNHVKDLLPHEHTKNAGHRPSKISKKCESRR
jgi:Holliday junction resolvase RusA-like endonuclease